MANTTYVRIHNANTSTGRLLTDTDFSNIIKKSSLERLAEADDHEVVKSIVEYFADFLVINPDLCSLPLSTRVFSSSPELWHQDSLSRTTEGVLAMLLALKKKPLIRFEKNSLLCKKLATEVRYAITQEEQLFDFRKPDTPPILLLIDRREDPVTPLLTQWTYQAMVHELLGIENGTPGPPTLRGAYSSINSVSQQPSLYPGARVLQHFNQNTVQHNFKLPAELTARCLRDLQLNSWLTNYHS